VYSIYFLSLIPAAKGTSSSSSKETNNNENENERSSTSDEEKQTWSPIRDENTSSDCQEERKKNELDCLVLLILGACFLFAFVLARCWSVQKSREEERRKPLKPSSAEERQKPPTSHFTQASKKRPKISHTVSWKGAYLCIAGVEIALPHLFMAWRCNHS